MWGGRRSWALQVSTQTTSHPIELPDCAVNRRGAQKLVRRRRNRLFPWQLELRPLLACVPLRWHCRGPSVPAVSHALQRPRELAPFVLHCCPGPPPAVAHLCVLTRRPQRSKLPRPIQELRQAPWQRREARTLVTSPTSSLSLALEGLQPQGGQLACPRCDDVLRPPSAW